ETANWLATEPGINALNAVFGNVNRTLNEMKPGLAAIGQAFLEMAGQSAAFDALTQAVNTFGSEFQASVIDLLSDGTLDRAFQGLGQMLSELARGFVQLVDNGIRVFAAAA